MPTIGLIFNILFYFALVISCIGTDVGLFSQPVSGRHVSTLFRVLHIHIAFDCLQGDHTLISPSSHLIHPHANRSLSDSPKSTHRPQAVPSFYPYRYSCVPTPSPRCPLTLLLPPPQSPRSSPAYLTRQYRNGSTATHRGASEGVVRRL